MTMFALMSSIASPRWSGPQWMRGKFHEHDARTLICASLKSAPMTSREKVITAQHIVDVVSQWIEQRAEFMPDDDPRKAGYLDLSIQLSKR